jgi:NADPH2:quinone reductase
MKAIRVSEFGGPEKLVLEDQPDLKPGAGQVVVKLHAAGVNPVEAYIRTGTYAMKPNLPYTPGMDGAGTVLAVGDGVTRVTKGDRVYCAGSVTGTYAEQALCNESQVHPLPSGTSFAQGAAMGVPYATAYRALFQKAHLMPGETVLIHGASGGVGSAAVQLARSNGAIVIGTGGTDAGRALVKKEGAHHVLDHHAADFADQLMKLTGGKGVHVIVEMLANKNLGKDLTLLGRGGRVVVVGSRGPVEINPRDAMAREAVIYGMVLFNTPEQDMAQIHAALVAGLESGTLRPVIAQEIPLKDAPRAHEEVLKPTGATGKIVLRIAAES